MDDLWTSEPWSTLPFTFSLSHHSFNLTHPPTISFESFNFTQLTYTPPIATEAPRPLAWNILIIIICSLIITGTLFGNVLVCLAVAITRKLRTPSNSLIVSLAFSDLFIAVTVMPFALVYEVTKGWIFGQVACDIWTSLDVFLCTSSILNLCAISIDRYFVITRPFTYALKRTPLRMAGMIVCVWVASAIISIPPQFGWRKKITEGQCVISEELGYQLFATVGAFYLPLAVMVTIYTRIYLVSSRLSKTTSYNRHSSLASTGGTLSSGDQLASSCQVNNNMKERRQSSPCFEPPYEVGDRVGKRRMSSSILLFERIVRRGHNNHQHYKAGDLKGRNLPLHSADVQIRGHSNLGLSESSLSSHKKKDRSRSMSQMFNKINHKFKLASVKTPKVNSERKATRTLGVIMGSFMACWLPFFILALVKPFLGELSENIPRWLDVVFLWLGYANSFINPIIYARFNRDFRVPFRLILQCKCHSINNQMRLSEFTEQYGKNQPLSSTHIKAGKEKKMKKVEVKAPGNSNLNNHSTRLSTRHQLKNLTHEEECVSFLHDNKQEDPRHPNVFHDDPDFNEDFDKQPMEQLNLTPSLKSSPQISYSISSKPSSHKLQPFLKPGRLKTALITAPSHNISHLPSTVINDNTNNSTFFKPIVKSSEVVGSCDTNKSNLLSNDMDIRQDHALPQNESLKTLQPHNNSYNICSHNDDNNTHHSNKSSTPTTSSKLRFTQKEFRKPNLLNQHKLYVPKSCYAPVINMNMLVEDDDEDDEDEDLMFKTKEGKTEVVSNKSPQIRKDPLEVHSQSRIQPSALSDNLVSDDIISISRVSSDSNSLSGTSREARRESEVRKGSESIQGCGREREKGGRREQPVSVERYPRLDEGTGSSCVLKVFNASFNEINHEDSFIF